MQLTAWQAFLCTADKASRALVGKLLSRGASEAPARGEHHGYLILEVGLNAQSSRSRCLEAISFNMIINCVAVPDYGRGCCIRFSFLQVLQA